MLRHRKGEREVILFATRRNPPGGKVTSASECGQLSLAGERLIKEAVINKIETIV